MTLSEEGIFYPDVNDGDPDTSFGSHPHVHFSGETTPSLRRSYTEVSIGYPHDSDPVPTRQWLWITLSGSRNCPEVSIGHPHDSDPGPTRQWVWDPLSLWVWINGLLRTSLGRASEKHTRGTEVRRMHLYKRSCGTP